MLFGNVSQKTVSRWIKDFNDNGKIATKISTGTTWSAKTEMNKRTDSVFLSFGKKIQRERVKNLPIILSNEKLFAVDKDFNKKNQTIYVISREEADLKEVNKINLIKQGLNSVSKFPLSAIE